MKRRGTTTNAGSGYAGYLSQTEYHNNISHEPRRMWWGSGYPASCRRDPPNA